MNLFLFCLWGAFYFLNVGLGFLTADTQLLKTAFMILAVISFVPGVLLLGNGYIQKDRKLILTIRKICIAVLALTTAALVAFFLCVAFASQGVVDVVFVLLSLVSAPMISGQYWFLGLFLWACLLSATFLKNPNQK